MQRLRELIEIVQSWPGISDCFSGKEFDAAVQEAYDARRLQRLEREATGNPLAKLAITPYLDDTLDTFNYASARLNDALGGKLLPWHRVYEEPGFDERLTLVDKALTPNRRCLKVEVIDAGEVWCPHNGVVPENTANLRPASVQVLFAGALDPDWVRDMRHDSKTPPVILAGYELARLTEQRKCSPRLWFDGHTNTGRLDAWDRNRATWDASIPLLWK